MRQSLPALRRQPADRPFASSSDTSERDEIRNQRLRLLRHAALFVGTADRPKIAPAAGVAGRRGGKSAQLDGPVDDPQREGALRARVVIDRDAVLAEAAGSRAVIQPPLGDAD